MTDIVSLMDESTSIIDLEGKLQKEGHNFGNYRSYFKFLRKKWHKVSFPKLRDIFESPLTKDEFPIVSVKSGGIEYLLHGIVHGWPPLFAPGWHPRKDFKDYVSGKMKDFYDPNREDYLYEQNFNDIFDLFAYRELKDVDSTQKRTSGFSIKDIGLIALSIPAGLFALFAIPALFGFTYICTKLITPTNKSQYNLCISQKALTDGKYQSKFADFLFAKEMPQPFNLEVDYILEKNSIFDFCVRSMFLEPNAATTSERSLWTARELKDYARFTGLNKLHYLGGAGHITAIKYFLEHPGYSFDRLEEWTKKK